ncbi:unnamed protein product [Prorocentrum cordatum]|uniref:Uncharacterized protein n=1 Tax=Prorocentrum cordatum TaxID=2364126 RepID=A0ABN9QMQ7_9DINO|nr:unnamed protein product [Polarella glacialis]
METLDERERKALAEQQLLREEIRRLDLEGIEAVAYVLRAKLGSYKRKAFRYFDVANQECFTMMAWDLGMTMLRINMEGLTGIPATRVFHQMNTTKDSTVSWREWKDFFKDVRQETFDKMDAMSAKSIEERAVKQQKKLLEAIQENLRTRSAKQHRVVQKTMSRQVSEDAESAVSEARETRPRKLTGGNSTNDAVDGAHKADRRSSSLPQHPTSKHGKRGAAQPADGPEHGAWEEQLSKMQDNECKRYAGLSSQAVKGIRDACHNIGFTLHESGAEGSVDVYNYRAFADAVRARLGGLGVGESAEFGDELNEVQRGLVRQIAKELGLRAADRDLEQGKCLVVTSKKALDDFAKVVERELRALEDGASKEFGPGLTEQQCAVVHAIAARLELAAVDAGPGSVAVGNVRTFSARVRNRLRALEPGGKAEFRWLTRVTSHAVRAIAAEMGLHSEDVEPAGGAEGGGGGGDACVEVHRLHEGPGGQPPSAAEGGAAAGAAPLSGGPAAEGASAAAAAEGGAAGWRQHGAPTGEAAAGEGSGDQIRSQQNLIENLFDTLATGSFQGQRIFLRFPDLGVLVSELNSSLANAVSTFKKYEKVLETTFNDTLQLQIDMDVRTSKGLTFRWFQVFMQTAMKKIGHSALAFLFTISRKAA